MPLLTVLRWTVYGCTISTALHKCTYIDTVDDSGRIAGALHMPGWAYEDDGGRLVRLLRLLCPFFSACEMWH